MHKSTKANGFLRGGVFGYSGIQFFENDVKRGIEIV